MTIPFSAHHAPGPRPCYRHTNRPTALSCTRCGRPACPECLRTAAVGQQCVDCVQAAAAAVPPVRTAAGGVLREGAPQVTYALIAANIAVYILQTVRPGIATKLALSPALTAGQDQYYRLLTSAFVHDGLLHIAFNMYALYVLGPPLERHLGRVRFLTLYLLSALGGSVLVYLFSDVWAPTVGASGAIFGIFGATFVAYRKFNLDARWLIGLLVANLALTFLVPNISWQGHIGGLITGVLVAAAYLYAPRAQRTIVQVGSCLALLAVFAALVAWRTPAILEVVGPMFGRG